MTEPGPSALDLVHVGWDHLRHQRPLAAWASWQSALRLRPGDPAATQALDRLAAAVDLPAAARAVYRLRSPSTPDARSRWDAAFREAGDDLSDPAAASVVFSRLVDADPDDAEAAYDLALCLAWHGRNAEAIAALDRFAHLIAPRDFSSAADAWTLAEVLRQGGGAEELADVLSCSFDIAWDGEPEEALAWLRARPDVVEKPALIDPITLQPVTASVVVFEWLDRPMPEPTHDLDGGELPRLEALALVEPGRVRFSSPDRYGLLELEHQVEPLGRPALERRATPLPLPMLDQAVASFRLPPGLEPEERDRLVREAVEHYFEDLWIHHERHGLDGQTPAAVARLDPRDPSNLARLEGIVRLQEQLAERPSAAHLYQGYPFDRLRRRLGLEPMSPHTLDTADLSCASAAELSALKPAELDEARLRDAYRSAHGLAASPNDPLTTFLDDAAQELSRRPPATTLPPPEPLP